MLSTKFAHVPPIPIRKDGQIINTIYDLSKEYYKIEFTLLQQTNPFTFTNINLLSKAIWAA